MERRYSGTMVGQGRERERGGEEGERERESERHRGTKEGFYQYAPLLKYTSHTRTHRHTHTYTKINTHNAERSVRADKKRGKERRESAMQRGQVRSLRQKPSETLPLKARPLERNIHK